ncbi:hypothetical protein HanIR_Chr14g0700771 [Helianthus annuus]|nr:hypothetical protein HanIR_Chr14g0700771 [Helianthus annuus]
MLVNLSSFIKRHCMELWMLSIFLNFCWSWNNLVVNNFTLGDSGNSELVVNNLVVSLKEFPLCSWVPKM